MMCLGGRETPMIAKTKALGICCSFCGRSKGEVANIISGTPQHAAGARKHQTSKSALICDECLRNCHDLVSSGGEVSPAPVTSKI
jgi:hypothetical protein